MIISIFEFNLASSDADAVDCSVDVVLFLLFSVKMCWSTGVGGLRPGFCVLNFLSILKLSLAIEIDAKKKAEQFFKITIIE